MIRNETEYQEAIRRFNKDREVVAAHRVALEEAGLTPEQVEVAMEPVLSFQQQLTEEITWYENVKRGNIPPTRSLTELGRLLIAFRIASNLTQKELATRLGVSEAQVSRDERNEYHGVTKERAQRILDALGVTLDNLSGRIVPSINEAAMSSVGDVEDDAEAEMNGSEEITERSQFLAAS